MQEWSAASLPSCQHHVHWQCWPPSQQGYLLLSDLLLNSAVSPGSRFSLQMCRMLKVCRPASVIPFPCPLHRTIAALDSDGHSWHSCLHGSKLMMCKLVNRIHFQCSLRGGCGSGGKGGRSPIRGSAVRHRAMNLLPGCHNGGEQISPWGQ